MPHLTYGEHIWNVGGDELALPVWWTIAGRALWSIAVLVFLIVHFPALLACPSGQLIAAYLFCTLLFHMIVTALDVAIAFRSMQGTMVEDFKRRGVGTMVMCKVWCTVLQSATALLAIAGIALQSQGIPCGSGPEATHVNLAVLLVILAAQLANMLVVLLCCKVCARRAPAGSAAEQLQERYEQRLRQLGWLCGGPGMRVGEGIRDAATVLDRMFRGHESLDLVASDIVAGLLLVRSEQRATRQAAALRLRQEAELVEEGLRCRRVVCQLPDGRARTVITDLRPHALLLADLTRLALLAGFPYSFAHPLPPCLSQLLCGPALRAVRQPGLYFGRGCWCGCRVRGDGLDFIAQDLTDLAARSISLPLTALAHLSDTSDLAHKPYAIFVDHLRSEVIVCVRGTASLDDVVSDVLCDPCTLADAGKMWGFDGDDRWAHDGMLRIADGLRRDLEIGGLLLRLTRGADGQRWPPFNVVITGHSLGAGVAVLLAIMLRAQYPGARCVAFGTPGAVLDARTAEEVRGYVTSVVLGNDMICRTSFRSLCALRDDVLDCIARAKRPKVAILRAATVDLSKEELLFAAGEEPASAFKDALLRFKEAVRPTYAEVEAKELSIAGLIVHLVRTTTSPLGDDFQLSLPSAEDFKAIPVSSSMVADHLTKHYFASLSALAVAAGQPELS